MYTIKENNQDLLEIKKSKFLSFIYKVSYLEEIDIILSNLKKEYSDATHICYAYIIGNTQKSSDDGEPGGTAGIPILQVLQKNNLNYVLAVVVRYFGGIKLGAGGLVRAYTKATREVIKGATKVQLIPGYKIKIISSYGNQKRNDYILKDYEYTKDYHSEIIYTAFIPKEKLKELNLKDITILDEIEIEK